MKQLAKSEVHRRSSELSVYERELYSGLLGQIRAVTVTIFWLKLSIERDRTLFKLREIIECEIVRNEQFLIHLNNKLEDLISKSNIGESNEYY